jgi:hypothetical protein
MASHKFTPEQIDWLTANRYELNNIEVVKQFNQRFELSLVKHQVTQACIRRGIKHKINGFQKGQTTWNKGLKGVNGTSSTTFKKGQISVNLLPIGTERLTKEGYIDIKLADPNIWAPKHRYIWEQAYGKLNSSQIIVFLSDNRQDFSLSNMALINRSEMATLNRHEKFGQQAPEIRAALINVVRLEQKIRRSAA